MDFDAFREDIKTVAAVERMMQIISEAAVRLGEDAERLYPDQPGRNIRGLGNWVRHQYDSVDRDYLEHNPRRLAKAQECSLSGDR